MNPVTDFNALSLPEAVKAALISQNITVPSPIQAQAIPWALEGKDVVGLAQTGTGKTLAFCLPLITALFKDENKDSTALILAPTREIAIQVTEVIKALTVELKGRWTPLLVIGGVGMQPQIDGLKKKPRLIIATPGRLVDHMREGVAKLDTVDFLVLDEADRMLDMGFAPQLNEILKGLPKKRQTMLFSATFPREIEEISQKYLNSPKRIEAGEGHSKAVDSVTQVIKEMSDDEKMPNLIEALKEREGTIIVFVRTKHRTERIAKQLEKVGQSAGRIHGDRSQSQRQATLGAFKEGKIRILVATDIAARGIDVPNVAHVINFDIPNVPEEYIHRIGRTGRAGATGESLTFVTPEVVEEWHAILKLIDPEKARSMPRPTNLVRADKPQQGHHGQRRDGHQDRGGQHARNDRGPRNDRSRDDRPRVDRPRVDRPRDDRPRDDRPREDRSHQGPRPDIRPPRPQQDNNDQIERGNRAAPQAQYTAPAVANDEEDDFYPQPTLEEQLTRIDRENTARRGNRGGQYPSNNRPNNNNNNTNHRGGGGGFQRNAGGQGGQGGGSRRWEAPKKHPYARPRGDGPSRDPQQEQRPQTAAPEAAPKAKDSSDESSGNN